MNRSLGRAKRILPIVTRASWKWRCDGLHSRFLSSTNPSWSVEAYRSPLRIPDVWLLAQKSTDALARAGRAIDHIGWTTTDTDVQIADLKAKGAVKIASEPRMVRHLKVALFDDSSGIRVEIVQNRTEEELKPR
jgi:hypothetical protein